MKHTINRITDISSNLNFSLFSIIIFTLYSQTYHVYVSVFKSFKLQLIVLGIAILFILFDYKQNSRKIKIIKTDVLWMVFLIVFLYSFRNYSIFVLSDLLFYALCIIYIVLAKSNVKDIEAGLSIIKWTSLFYAVGVIVQFSAIDFYLQNILPIFTMDGQQSILFLLGRDYYSGFTHQTAHTAGYLLNGIGVIILSINSKNKKAAHRNILFLIPLLFALILTGKRAHFVFMGVALFITYLYRAIKTNNIRKFTQIFLLYFVMLITFVIILDVLGVNTLWDRMYSSITGVFQGQDISSGRTILYNAAWEIFHDNPIFGIGWHQFHQNSAGILIVNVESNVHNIYLQLLAETGIVGLMLFSIPVLYALIGSFKLLHHSLKDGDKSIYIFPLSYSLFYQIFFLLYGLTGNGLNDKNFISMYFFAIIIYGSILTRRKYEEESVFLDDSL